MTQFDTLDRLAVATSGALLTLGVVVLGLVEVLAGKPYGAAPMTNDAGEVVATPMIDPTIRTGLVILGFVVLGVWGLYRVATTTPTTDSERSESRVTAD
jgi:hypothetical protein